MDEIMRSVKCQVPSAKCQVPSAVNVHVTIALIVIYSATHTDMEQSVYLSSSPTLPLHEQAGTHLLYSSWGNTDKGPSDKFAHWVVFVF